jgi:hypothetical protein
MSKFAGSSEAFSSRRFPAASKCGALSFIGGDFCRSFYEDLRFVA